MGLDTLLRLQTAADQAPMQNMGELTNVLSETIRNRNARSLEQDALKFFGDGNVSIDKIQQFQQMYPGVPVQDIMRQATTAGNFVEAQQMKDIYNTIGSIVSNNGGKLEPKAFQEAVGKFNPQVRAKFMEHLAKNPNMIKAWKPEVTQRDPQHDTVSTDMFGNETTVKTGVPKAVTEEATIYGPNGQTRKVAYMKGSSYTPPEGWSLKSPSEETPIAAAVKDMMKKTNPETGQQYTASEAYKAVTTNQDKEMKILGLIDIINDPKASQEKKDEARQKLATAKEFYAQNLVLGGTPSGDLLIGKTRGPVNPQLISSGTDERIIDVKAQPLPEKAEDKLTGALDMFDLLDVLERTKNVGIPVPAVGEATTYLQSKLGVQDAQDFLTAKNQLKANAQTIIKGIPSNFDVETFIKTLPSETDTASEKATKIAQSKRLLMNALNTGIQNYKDSKYIIPQYLLDRFNKKAGDGAPNHNLPIERKVINGKNYIKQSGKWFEVK